MSQESLKYYNNYQEIYLRPENYFDSIAKELAEYLPEADLKILDIGCGFGDLLSAIHERLGNRAEYYGLTIANHETEFIRKERPFIKVVLGREQDLKKTFDDRTFDLILNFHTLSYIKQKEQIAVTKKMIDLLRLNGMIYLGLIDSWIKLSGGISQQGDGFVQFYYSPKIFLVLDRYCRLISSKTKKEDNYRLHLWQKQSKSSTPWKGALLYTKYMLGNNLLRIGHFQKLVRKLKR